LARREPSRRIVPSQRRPRRRAAVADSGCTDACGCAKLRAARMPTAHPAPAPHRGDAFSLR
jgi:hypothetical protein